MMYVCLYVCVCIIFIIIFPSTYLFYKMHKSLPIRMSEMEVIMMLWILELKGELQHGMHPKFLQGTQHAWYRILWWWLLLWIIFNMAFCLTCRRRHSPQQLESDTFHHKITLSNKYYTHHALFYKFSYHFSYYILKELIWYVKCLGVCDSQLAY